MFYLIEFGQIQPGSTWPNLIEVNLVKFGRNFDTSESIEFCPFSAKDKSVVFTHFFLRTT